MRKNVETRPIKSQRCNADERGFALVVTVSIMVLLALLAVGLLSLSTVALRSSSSGKNQAIARSNAKLSLQMALSQLQLLAGADTRVTAPASAVSGVNGPDQLHGVWRSWEGTNHNERTGEPIAPDYGSKLNDGDVDGTGSGKFLGWLISGEESENGADSPSQLSPGSDTVALLAEGTLGSSTDKEVHLVPTPVDDGGAYAWWISGENTKARLKPVESPNGNFETSEQMLVTPGPSGSGFNIDDTSQTDKAITLQSLNFMAQDDSQKPSQYFHDLSPYSRGLLTNTANGGWRRDLSLLTENWRRVRDGFPSFTLSPGNVFEAGKSNTGSSQHPLIYPWADWSRSSAWRACVSWAALADWATQYRQLRTAGKEVGQMLTAVEHTHVNWLDKVRRIPILTRVHLVISLASRADGTGKYYPALQITPVLTVWNPYSVALDMSSEPWVNFKLNDASCPLNFDFRLDASQTTRDLAAIVTNNGGNSSNLTCRVPLATRTSPGVWLPGEVRVFSPVDSLVANMNRGNTITFDAGYRPNSGLNYRVGLPNASQPVAKEATTQFAVSKARISATFNGPNVKGTGMYFTYALGPGSNPSTTNVQCMLDQQDAYRMLGEEVPLTSTTPFSLASLARSPQPFVSIVTGLRYARDTNPNRDNILVNGVHNMNPVVGFMVNGADADTSALQGRFDPFPYNIQLFPVNDLADPGMPSGIAGDLEGYMASGFDSADGLSNLILLELPTRPLRSIGDLQHFNVNACNLTAPYTLNAIGNSQSSPFISSDEIKVAALERGHDHSYASNHVLMDDWFVSTVSPEMSEWSAREARSLQNVYTDHLSGEEPLPNHHYKPATPVADGEASSKASDFLSDTDSWQKVAAELEVEGMFNINSTSELAWEMILKRNFGSSSGGGSENASVLTLDDSTPGNTNAGASLVEGYDSPFPRTSLSSDPDAGGLGGGSTLSQAPNFTDEQIKALAREIVVEIKKRGPFLSLGEFYNRQLASYGELTRAGAVESALLRLSESPASENPYTDLLASFSGQASTTNFLGQRLTHPFAEASRGNPAYGFPGWTRQADVLRPLSGILTARDDTFTIRAYGDARDPATNRIVSRAWCEAVVQRKADFVDTSENGGDDKYTLPSESTLNSPANHRFGRSFEIVQFRWLHPDEV